MTTNQDICDAPCDVTQTVVWQAVTERHENALPLGKCDACIHDTGKVGYAADASYTHGPTRLALCDLCLDSLWSWENDGGVTDAPELLAWAFGVELDDESGVA